MSLKDQRLGTVQAVLKASGARSVIDLGCGAGALLERLLKDGYTDLAGADVSARALAIAERRLKTDAVTLLHSPLTYRDKRFAHYDAAALVEVIEHFDPPRLRAVEENVFGTRPAQDGRGDHARTPSTTTCGRALRGLPPPRPPLRVDARGVRRLGGARHRDATTATAPASSRSARRIPRPAHPRRWRCSSDEDRAGRPLPRRADRCLRLRQEHVRGPPLPAHRDRQLRLLPRARGRRPQRPGRDQGRVRGAARDHVAGGSPAAG